MTPLNGAAGLAVDDGSIYVTANTVSSGALDVAAISDAGVSPSTLATVPGQAGSAALDSSNVYFTMSSCPSDGGACVGGVLKLAK